MADLINLRQARKRKQRVEKDNAAAANWQAYGRSASEREKTALTGALEERRLAGHRRDKQEVAED
jgi:hypothetical protein